MKKVKIYITKIDKQSEYDKDFTIVLQNNEYAIGIAVGKQEATMLVGAFDDIAKNKIPYHLVGKILEPLNYKVTEVVLENIIDGFFNCLVYYSNGKNIFTINTNAAEALTLATINNTPIYIIESILSDIGTKL